jgi:hypothetical protein
MSKSMASADLLPPQFSELSRFVEYWVRDHNDQRWDQRSRAPMEEIQQFYEALLPRAEDIIAHLDHYPLGDDLPAAEGRLARLLLALGQAAIAVEMHGQPRTAYSQFPHNIHVVKGPWPLG